MTVRKTAVAAALASVVAVAALSACSSDGDDGLAGESAKKIEKEAKDAMMSAKSMTLNADMTSDGQKMTMELAMSKSGDCTGTISVDGANAEILRVDSESYMKPDRKFWEDNAGGAAQAELIENAVDGRWVESGGSENDFASFCDLDELLEDMDKEDKGDKGDGKLEKGAESEVDGTPTITLKQKESKDEGGGTSTMHVATEGKPYVLKMENKGGDEPGTATFSGFDEKVDVKAPAAADTVDLSELGG